ncbi:translocation/assembly module TamB [Halomonas campisalis]|uniref:Translocation/assembly module TamB n=1 Tax=Billgrantia campisalis TaxID=74661 RepID=A0ABS9P5Q2_9GAMM|nr:translocation/assembly module TamB domain-containing protein [Halomonas campisalis]MCG6657108.1 translocation/assembly module TamB [Halomonas campisalis]MDR5862293.1 translocation/assembly module TamB [Halomonas campisalis]
MRALLWLLVAVPLWCLGLVLLVLGLALSPWGSGLLLEEGAKRGFYELADAEGAPLDRLVLHDFKLEAGPARVRLQRLELAWADDCLLRGQLCIERLAVEGARIRLGAGDADVEAEAPAVGEPLDEIRLPFPLSIRALSLIDVDLQLADGTRVTFEEFTTGAEAEASTLTLLPTRLGGLRVQLPLSAGVRLALSEAEHDGPRLTAEAIDAAIAVQSPLPAVAAAELQDLAARPLEDRERLSLPEIELPLRLRVPELIVEDAALSGPLDYAIQRLSLSLEARGQVVEIAPLELATQDTDARLSARVELRDDYPLEARLEASLWLPEIMPELAGKRLDLRLDGSLGGLDVDLQTWGPVNARLTAHLDALDPTLPFSAAFKSELLQWPLPPHEGTVGDETDDQAPPPVGDPYVIEDLTLQLEGSLLAYRAALSMRVEGPEVPLTRVALSGSGDLQHFAWTPLSLTLGRASVVSRGRVGWAEGLDVEAVLRLDNLDPGAFTEAVQGRLSGDIELDFVQSAQGWRLQVPRLAIGGELQSLPLSLQARLAGDSEMRWTIDELDFRQGANRLTASGRVSDTQLDLGGEFDLPALASLHDELGGTLAGRFTASGSLEAPQLDFELSGDGLAFAENRLDSLRLSGRVSGIDDPDLDLSLAIERLNAGGQRFSEVSLNLDGRLSAHRLTLEAIAGRGMPLSRAVLAVEGGLSEDRQRYAGQLTPLEVDSENGDIRLVDPLTFDVNIAAASARVQPFCLRREQGGRVCLDETLEASADQGRAVLSVRDLSMTILEEWLPPDWAAEGETLLSLVVEWRQAGAQWGARADLETTLSLQGLDAYGQPWQLPNSRLTLEVDASQARVDLDLGLQLDDAGRIGLALRLDDPLTGGSLDGRLILDDIQLSRYRTLVTGMDELEGRLVGDVNITGRREAPQLDGSITLEGLRASGLDLPLMVQDGRVRIRLAGDRGDIDGHLVTDDGRLEIVGDAAWPSPDDWRLAIDLDGTRQPLLVTMPEFGRLRVAPDIRVRIDPSRLQVRGAVQVPWARLEVGEVPAAAVSPSPDEIIITRRDEERARRAAEREGLDEDAGVDETAAAALREAGMAMDVRIDLRLGPDMQLEAYGLQAGLRGILEVRQQAGPVQLFGDVNLVDGRFRAFGQDLLIRQGQLFFSGPPDQPLLDFEAIRNPDVTEDGVIAGLRVSGFAAEPRLAIFSEPAMDEARALSYLLRGRAPRDGDADGALTSALIGLTLGRTGGAVGAIGEVFGIADLALEAAGAGDDRQIVVSGYITEDLRVSYGVGIFSPIAELTLRYTLWRNLYLQAVSGAAQAVDLVYTFSLPGKPPQIDASSTGD